MKFSPVDLIKTASASVAIVSFKNLIRELPIAAVEQSVKVTRNKILSNRINVLIERKDFLLPELKFFLQRKLNFPVESLAEFPINYYWADNIGLSIEVDENNKVNYRCYLEKLQTEWSIAKYIKSGEKVIRTLTSFKWDPNLVPATACNRTHYDLLINITKYGEALEEIENSGFGKPPLFISDMIFRDEPFKMYRAKDSISKRSSFDIALFNKPYYLNDLSEDIVSVNKDENIKDKISFLSDNRMHHFSGGIDKNGDKFYNAYFVIYNKYDISAHKHYAFPK